jgi:hypothetical protein
VRLKELRVYINPAGADALAKHGVFYSRRADGPYYRWLFEEGQAQWCCSRVHLPNLTLKTLRIAHWQTVPDALRETLIEYYAE